MSMSSCLTVVSAAGGLAVRPGFTLQIPYSSVPTRRPIRSASQPA